MPLANQLPFPLRGRLASDSTEHQRRQGKRTTTRVAADADAQAIEGESEMPTLLDLYVSQAEIKRELQEAEDEGQGDWAADLKVKLRDINREIEQRKLAEGKR